MFKVLITGFEAYWDYPENSSWVVAENVAAQPIEGVQVAKELMPVSFSRVATSLRTAVEKHTPNLLVQLGQSGGSNRVKLERIAINLMDSKLADNDDYIPDEEPICTHGASALFANVSTKKLRIAIEEMGIPVKISNSCGLYVCNRLYYEGLALCETRPAMRAIFVHLPFYEGQPSAKPEKPTLPLVDMVKAIVTIIRSVKDDASRV